MKRFVAIVLSISTLLAGCTASDRFEEKTFLSNGPYQQGTISIDRSKLQTVVTWCSPTLLQMAVYDNVQESYPTEYTQLKGKDHPLQMSVTVFPQDLPFSYAAEYSKPKDVTSICSPASIQTTLSTETGNSPTLNKNLGQSFEVRSDKMVAVKVDCNACKAGYSELDHFNGPDYGKEGGVALIPAGEASDVIGECKDNIFSIQINPAN
ncbi:hypothetical protein [Synechococcus sp. UW179A]|uniref:hypothetical protein n=1 Tax=Synechococcus sp. UW179A TaxID=2575510 RepID=UPI000E0FB9ED|nr:hypothetical protein [Synechococcus sp. UW179A]